MRRIKSQYSRTLTLDGPMSGAPRRGVIISSERQPEALMRVLMNTVPADYLLRGFVAVALVVGRFMLGALVPRGGVRRLGSAGGRNAVSTRRRDANRRWRH